MRFEATQLKPSAYQTENIVRVFSDVARPIILNYFPLNCCVAASRITIKALRAYGVPVHAYSAKLIVTAPTLKRAFVSGLTPEEKAESKRRSEHWIDLRTAFPFEHHVVTIADRSWLIDASFDQISTAFGIDMEREVFLLAIPRQLHHDNLDIQATGVLNDNSKLEIRIITTADRSFESTPAWETDHLQPAIADILVEMRKRL